MARTSPQGPPAGRSPRRVSVRAFWRSASCSRRSSSERVPPRVLRTDRTSKPPRRRGLHNGHTGLLLSSRRRASALQRASPPGMSHRRRRPPPAAARRNGRITRLRCARACASCSSPWPCGVGPRGSSPRRGPRRPFAWRSGRARRPVPSRRRLRTGCARARGDVSRTWDTTPARVGRRRVCGDVHILSCVPARGPCRAFVSPPLSTACFGQKIPSPRPPSTVRPRS